MIAECQEGAGVARERGRGEKVRLHYCNVKRGQVRSMATHNKLPHHPQSFSFHFTPLPLLPLFHLLGGWHDGVAVHGHGVEVARLLGAAHQGGHQLDSSGVKGVGGPVTISIWTVTPATGGNPHQSTTCESGKKDVWNVLLLCEC